MRPRQRARRIARRKRAAIRTRSAPTPSAAALRSAASITSFASSERTQSISGQLPAWSAPLSANSAVQGAIEQPPAGSPKDTVSDRWPLRPKPQPPYPIPLPYELGGC